MRLIPNIRPAPPSVPTLLRSMLDSLDIPLEAFMADLEVGMAQDAVFSGAAGPHQNMGLAQSARLPIMHVRIDRDGFDAVIWLTLKAKAHCRLGTTELVIAGATLPATMLVAIPGHPLNEIVSHPWIDGMAMPVTQIEQTGDTIRIHFDDPADRDCARAA